MTGEQIKTPISLNVSSKNGRIVVSGYGSWVGNWMEKAMATHSSTLSGKVPWMEEPGRLQSTGSLGVRHDFTFTFMHWRRKWHHTPVFLPGESQGRESRVGCRVWGRTSVGHDWSYLAVAVTFSPLSSIYLPVSNILFEHLISKTNRTFDFWSLSLPRKFIFHPGFSVSVIGIPIHRLLKP